MAIAAKFQKLLDCCQEVELSHLRPLMDRMFENADVALLDFAEKAESNSAQAVFFEAMNEVRKKRKNIEQHFYTELKTGFSVFPAGPDQSQRDESQENDFEKLLAGCQDMTLSHLRPLMDRMFENADVALLDFAEKPKATWRKACFSKP